MASQEEANFETEARHIKTVFWFDEEQRMIDSGVEAAEAHRFCQEYLRLAIGEAAITQE